nr:hypothetical protein [Tanacetum cinerariifolium]
MFKEQKPNNLKLYSKGTDKRRTSLNKVVPVQMKELVLNQGFRMYHLMTRRKNFHETLPTMKMLVVMKKATSLMKVMMIVMK